MLQPAEVGSSEDDDSDYSDKESDGKADKVHKPKLLR